MNCIESELPVLSRVRKVRKAQLAEMASKVPWASLDQPAPWVLLEKMEIRYGVFGVCVARQAVGERAVLKTAADMMKRICLAEPGWTPSTWHEGVILKLAHK